MHEPADLLVPLGNDAVTAALLPRLVKFISSKLDPNSEVEVEGLERIPNGFSRENWHFRAQWRANGETRSHELILRRDPLASVVESDRRVEFLALQALSGSAVPTPRVYWIDPDGEWLERPSIVMQYYRGIGERHILASNSAGLDLATRYALAETGLAHLVTLHALDWAELGFDAVFPDPDSHRPQAAISHWESRLRQQALEPQPELVDVCYWLHEHLPIAPDTTLVHGDWKPGNWLVKDGKFVVALDWEFVHLGDPLEDLGWVTNPLRRSMHEIAGHFERREIVERYCQLSGRDVAEDHLQFWNVFSAFKIAVVELTGIRSFCSGRSERPWRTDRRLLRYLLETIAD